jgi:hypothetical protein
MIFGCWLARRRLNSLNVSLAGLRAKLAGTQAAIRFVAKGSYIPGSMVYDSLDLPRQIAEHEERKRQIEAALGPNVGGNPQ